MKEFGLQFGYHNHNFEFANVEGKIPYFDIMFAELTGSRGHEMDMFWVAGPATIRWISSTSIPAASLFPPEGRYGSFLLTLMLLRVTSLLSVKALFLSRIIAAKDIAGMKYMIVEQDESRMEICSLTFRKHHQPYYKNPCLIPGIRKLHKIKRSV